MRGDKQEEMSVALHEEPINISEVQGSVKGKIKSNPFQTLAGDESDSHNRGYRLTTEDTGDYTGISQKIRKYHQSQGINCTKVPYQELSPFQKHDGRRTRKSQSV